MSSDFDTDLRPFAFEQSLYKNGYKWIAGVDEVGRGALAGPVVAAAVIMKPPSKNILFRIKDSKAISPQEREKLFPLIRDNAISIGVGFIDSKEIDQINILQATKKAMQKALSQLNPVPDLCLIDGNIHLPITAQQISIIKGDAKVTSIAAASIVAKVTRDLYMVELHDDFPVYEFSRHKGYGTSIHRKALQKHGPCEFHRRSFSLGV